MRSREYGYIRVSSTDQNTDRQLIALKEIGINEDYIFIDKVSGKNFDRPEYQLLKRVLREGDTLFIKSLDRFGRNKAEILKEWQWLMDNGIDVAVLDMPILDTRKYRELNGVGELITSLVLQILSWLAEEERVNIKQRQAEGIAAARSKGVALGRPRIEVDDKFVEVYDCWKSGEITGVKAMEQLGMKKTTFYARVKEYEEDKAGQ